MVLYEIKCKEDGRFYIGASINHHTRYLEHFNALRKNKHHNIFLQRAFNKYGEKAFSFTILQEFSNESEMWAAEEIEIEKRTNIYNVMPGGIRGPRLFGKDNSKYGKPISEQQRRLQSEAMSGKNHPFYGKKRPDQSAFMKKQNPMHTHSIDFSGANNPNAKHFNHFDKVKELREKGLTWNQIAETMKLKSGEYLRRSFNKFYK